MLDYMKRRPMLLCALIAAAVCAAGYYSRAAVFIIGIGLILLFFAMLYKKINPVFPAVALILVFISANLLYTCGKIEKITKADGTVVSGGFIALESPEKYDGFYSAALEACGCPGLENGTRVLAFFYGNKTEFECGDIISAEISLRKADGDYKAGSYADKIYLTGSAEFTAVTEKGGDFILSAFNNVRRYITETLFGNIGYREAATLAAVVFGDDSYFTEEFISNIRGAGVSHVMVVSGMHLAVIVSLVTRFSEKFVYSRGLKAFLMFLTVVLMTALCGFTKSIIRAGVCYIIYAVGILLKRENDSVNTLGGAVSLILAAEPFAVLSVSFQLSVLSTLGIVAAAVPVMRYIACKRLFKSRLLFSVLSSFAVTLSALLFTLPVTVYVFGYISAVSVAANLLISYAVTAALSVSAAGLAVFALFPPAGSILLRAAGAVTEYINFIIDEFGSLPFAVVTFGKYTFVLSVILLLAITAALFSCKKREDMLKLKKLNRKIVREGGNKLKWR